MKKDTFDGDLPISEYFEKNIGQIAQYFGWPMDPTTGDYRDYTKHYNTILTITRRYGEGIGISHWDPMDLERMLARAKLAGYEYGTKVYADSTVEGWRSFLRKIYEYAAYAGDSPDKMKYLTTLKARTSFADFSEDKPLAERQKSCSKLFVRRRSSRRSLTPSQLQIVIEKATELLPVQGVALAILILSYTGLRPSEVLGLKVGDYIHYVQHSGYFLSVVRQVNADGSIKDRLKRNASYRKVPVHFELQALIEKRIALICEHLPDHAQIEQYPLCCWNNDFPNHCRPYRLSELAREFLNQACVEDLVYENAMLDLYMTEPTLNGQEAEEFDCHTYLLRHTFWTMIQSSSELDADEKRVIFGHAVWHDAEEQNAGYNYEELLHGIHEKLQHIVFYPPSHQPLMVETLREDQVVVRGRVGELTLVLPAEALEKGGKCIVHITSLKRGDPVVVETLPEMTALCGSSALTTEVNLVPWPAPDDKSLVCDLHSWRCGKFHLKKRE